MTTPITLNWREKAALECLSLIHISQGIVR